MSIWWMHIAFCMAPDILEPPKNMKKLALCTIDKWVPINEPALTMWPGKFILMI